MATNVKDLMQSLRPEINAALAEIAKHHGLSKLHLAGGTYSAEGNFVFKLEGLMVGGLDKDAERYKHAAFLRLPPLGTELVIGSLSYKTAGVNKTGSKVIMERADGKRFLYPLDVVVRLASLASLAKVKAAGQVVA